MPKQTITDKCQAGLLHVNSFLSRTSYLRVKENNASGLTVENESGMTWNIATSIVSQECYTAHSFHETRELTRTELVAEFNRIGDAIFTVNFNKQPKLEEAFDAVAIKGKLQSNKDLKKALAEKMKGEERTLIGYVLTRDESLGRSMVVDLEQPKDDRIRQVDHRTLNWFICRNIKYVVKSK